MIIYREDKISYPPNMSVTATVPMKATSYSRLHWLQPKAIQTVLPLVRALTGRTATFSW